MMHRTLLAFAVWLFTVIVPLSAQDSHYWSNMFGTRSSLLSGSVVAGNNSNSMVFYNPGALGLIDSSSFSINASLYQLEIVKISNSAGQNATLSNTHLGTLPLMISGLIRNRRNARVKFGYGVYTPVDYQFSSDARLEGDYNIVDDEESPGAEEFVGQYDVDTRLNETLFLLGMGYRLMDQLSVGGSIGVTIRNHIYNASVLTRTIMNVQDSTGELSVITSDEIDHMDYFQARLNGKFGISYRADNYALGFTVTTPGLTVISNGNVRADVTAINVEFRDSMRHNLVANGAQYDLPAKYKTPWSFALGFSALLNKSYLNVSVEYFTSIPVYKIIAAEQADFIQPPDLLPEVSTEEYLSVYGGARSVFNIALGYERQVRDFFSLIAGFRTNFTYYDDALDDYYGATPLTTQWDIFYLTVGGRFSNARNDLMVGLQFGYGGAPVSNLVDLSAIVGQGVLEELNSDVTGRYTNIGLILGWNYIFKSKPGD